MIGNGQYVRKLGAVAQREVNMTRSGRVPLTDDMMAGLVRLYGRMPPTRQREFWQLAGTQLDKAAFLLRWGSFEVYETKAEEKPHEHMAAYAEIPEPVCNR